MKESKLFKKVINIEVIDKDKIRSNILSTDLNKSAKVNFFAKKGALAFIIAFVMLISTILPLISVYNSYHYLNASPQVTQSYDELFNVIDNFKVKEQKVKTFNLQKFLSGLISFFTNSTAEFNSDSGLNFTASGGDYSKTNIQTDGLDEGDIVKTDGQYIYKLNDKGFFIIAANNGELEVITSIIIDNYVPKEMYIWGNKLILIGGTGNNIYSNWWRASPMLDYLSYINYSKTDIRIYDIAQIESPVLNRQVTVDGKLNTSRLKIEDGKLLYTVNYGFNYYTESAYIPKIKDTAINNGEETYIPAENIYYYDDVVSYKYLIVGEINLAEPEINSKLVAYLGLGGTIYVSQDYIYSATYDYQSAYKKNILGWVSDDATLGSTRIVKIALDTLTQTATGRVIGKINDRYWMDEFEGNLRVATVVSGWEMQSYSNVFVLNSSLSIIGKIEHIAPGETIYSVRFNEITGSLVTFRQVDPYFNLDLSNPNKPLISDGLKEDGVSHYIHYIGDTAYTIGVGRMSEVVQSNWGEWVKWTGLKVSLYDNSSGEAVNINTIVLEGSCYAELFYNPKALLYDEDRGLFAFAYENWQQSGWYYTSMQQGLAVFKFDLTQEDEQKLVYRGTLTNLETEVDANSGSSYRNNYWSFINRGIRIGDYVYTVSHKFIKSYLLTTLEQIGSLNLYEIGE